MHCRTAVFLVALGAGACGAQEATSPDLTDEVRLKQALPEQGASALVVMTRNIYVGSNIDSIALAESVPDLLARVAHQYGVIQSTDFAARAGALADEVAATRPHLIGLQEVSTILRQFPGLVITGEDTPATEVVYDYLDMLLTALRARGLEYRVAALTEDWDVELPSGTGEDVRLIDQEAILARADVVTDQVEQRNFAVNLTLPVAGIPVTLTRGWAAVRASVNGRTYRFVSTHLEPANIPDLHPLQMAQAAELAEHYATESLPLILVGDLNTNADGTSSPTYRMFMNAGFVDSWAQAHPRDPGYSCCQASGLTNPASELVKRVDYVLVRDGFGNPAGRVTGGVHVDIVGEDPADRTASGLWPSDHAGFVARLALARAPGGS